VKPETLLAFDFGEKRIGVAVGNTLARRAQPLRVLCASNQASRLLQIGELIEEWQPDRLVMGIPYSAEGAEHLLTRRAERFARQLEGRFGLPVERIDERFSSVQAEVVRRELREQGLVRKSTGIDHFAAEIILQHFFESTHAQLTA